MVIANADGSDHCEGSNVISTLGGKGMNATLDERCAYANHCPVLDKLSVEVKVSTTGVDVGVESGNGEYAVIGGAPAGHGTETKDESFLVCLGSNVLSV